MGYELGRRVYKGPSTASTRIIRDRVQSTHVKQLWCLLGSILLFLSLVRFVRHVCCRLFPRISAPSPPRGEKGSEDLQRPDRLPLVRRLSTSIITAFRIVLFRLSIPIGPGSTASVSEVMFILAYTAAMFIWLLVDTHDLWTVMYQDRAALLAASQLPLIVSLAGKNNLISWMTGISHERLNVLHRAAARVCFIFSWLHAITRVVSGLPSQFSFQNDWMRSGAVSLAALSIATMLSIRPIRSMAFEFFLISHITLVFIFIVSGFFHAKANGHGDYIWPALVIWGFDRALRVGHLVWNNHLWRSSRSEALIELISDDTIRVTLRRKLTWTPGQHAYLILPTISKMPFEAHPFTIASIPEDTTEETESDIIFLIRARNGFTARLQKKAAENPRNSIPALLDGPYGYPPDLRPFSTCILIAGGSGVSYTLPLLLSLVRDSEKRSNSCLKRVIFLWAVRDGAHLSWISQILTEALARAAPSLAIEPRVYITGKDFPIPEVSNLPHSSSSFSSRLEKNIDITEAELPVYSTLKLTHGRPSIKKLLHDEISISLGPISVDVAGPAGITESVRLALQTGLASPKATLKGAQPVTLHVETFGMVKK